ncbi:DUF421 domain-containing protein [Clostridium swellfunianum]|uniref:YetF domain-containing protein n=1 Tax=Clostridium swellfunianum TaxID=1367462 RepID=UPI0020302096|nr:YetF domain-containing protein [Clostridium swellfunianum]MCM0647273.1 DUF421 domain-containing protein [Clostridium swellfunianum]
MDISVFFEGSKDLSIFFTILRTIILYISLIIATRIMGHRQVGILSGHNYLVAAGIVSLATVRMVNPESSLTSGLVIVFVYSGINLLLSFIDSKLPKLIDRGSIILMQNGILLKNNMKDAHITIDNLLAQLRLKGAHNLSEIHTIILEPNGKISVIKRSHAVPLNRKQMNLPIRNATLPSILIYNGNVDYNLLKEKGLNTEWLLKKIYERGFTDVEGIFLAMLEADGSLYVSV